MTQRCRSHPLQLAVFSVPFLFMDIPFFILAQIAPDEIELTAGGVIAGLLVVSALAGSIAMIVVWGTRFHQAGEVLPGASRTPLFVPKLLIIAGIGLTVLMAPWRCRTQLRRKWLRRMPPPSRECGR